MKLKAALVLIFNYCNSSDIKILTSDNYEVGITKYFSECSSTLNNCIEYKNNNSQLTQAKEPIIIPIDINKLKIHQLIELIANLRPVNIVEKRDQMLKEKAFIILENLKEIDFLGLTQSIYGTENSASKYREDLYFLCKEILKNKKFSEIINFLQKIQIGENKFAYDYATKTMLSAWAKLNSQNFVRSRKLELPKPIFTYQLSLLSKNSLINISFFQNILTIKFPSKISIINQKNFQHLEESNYKIAKNKDELICILTKDNQLKIWNIQNNSQFLINPKIENIIKIRFSSDKKKLLVWSKKTLKIFNLEKRKKIFRHDSSQEIFDAQIAKNNQIITLLKNGLFLLEGICAKEIKRIEKVDNKSKLIVKEETIVIKVRNEINSFKIIDNQFKPIEQSNFNGALTEKDIKNVKLLNYQYIATLTVDGILDLFDTISNKHQNIIYQIIADNSQLDTQTKISDKISCFTFSNDNEHIATGSYGGVVKIWKINNPQPSCVFTFKSHSKPISSIKFSEDNKKIITSCNQLKSVKFFYSTPEKTLERCDPKKILEWEKEIARKNQ